MKLQGIVPPIVTPLHARDAVDREGLERLIEHMLAGGVHGIFALGSTGEAPSLSYEARRDMIRATCQLVNGRVPVVVGITDTAIAESLHLAKYAADQGADAVVAAPPYYFPTEPPELQEYYLHLNQELPLPLILYNMPGLTKVQMSVDMVRTLMDQPNIIGIKDSSCSMMYYQKLLKLTERRPGWFTLIGPEELLCESVMQGGNGGVHGGANLVPSLFVKTYEAVLAHDYDRALALQRQILKLGDAIYRVGKYGSAIIKGLKCALALSDICDDYMADPLHRFRQEEQTIIRKNLEDLKASGILTP